MDELITEEQILALTNNQKREEFLKTWTQWPVLVEVPILKLTARQIVLPNKKRIVSLEYGPISPINDKYCNCYFQELNLTEGISPFIISCRSASRATRRASILTEARHLSLLPA